MGSFLVKNLLLHWHHGEAWFWDCLVDADLASNSAGWQWIAGCGADAAPYFRIFNPVLQGEKFDKDGIYTKQFVPELKDLPNKYLHCPWTAPGHDHRYRCWKTHGHGIVDLKQSLAQSCDVYFYDLANSMGINQLHGYFLFKNFQ